MKLTNTSTATYATVINIAVGDKTDPPNIPPTTVPAFPLEAAREFLRRYNALRFGGKASPEVLAALRQQLDRLEEKSASG